MEDIRELAANLFNLQTVNNACKCGGSHDICLHCHPCRAMNPDELATDFDKIAKYIDHTMLKPEALKNEIKRLCQEAEDYQFKSVCINPYFVNIAKLNVESALVCSVIGFPLGMSTTEVKVFETQKAIEQGAKEIDMVINVGALLGKEYKIVENDIAEVVKVCHKSNVLLKVILETCLLADTEKIMACLIAKRAGADFVKTSTGFNKSGATPEDVKLMRDVVGPKMGVKASGGIRNKKTALKMLKSGANRIGASASIAIVEEN